MRHSQKVATSTIGDGISGGVGMEGGAIPTAADIGFVTSITILGCDHRAATSIFEFMIHHRWCRRTGNGSDKTIGNTGIGMAHVAACGLRTYIGVKASSAGRTGSIFMTSGAVVHKIAGNCRVDQLLRQCLSNFGSCRCGISSARSVGQFGGGDTPVVPS